jgi:3-hydroxyacyl-CoA dehydrogenase
MKRKISKVAVIGSGVMGAGIAAHLANVGIPSLLLDIVPKTLTPEEEAEGLTLNDPKVRNRIAEAGKARLLKEKPAPLYDPSRIELITTGNLEDHLHLLKEVDWIIEVVVENLDVKRSVFEKVDAYRKPGSIVSSNTSGISIHAMAEGRSEDFRRNFLGTHFFNPPRYLKLLEIIPHKETDPELVEFMKEFGTKTLGKGIVVCKDTVNFIANRIGTYGLLITVDEMVKGGYGIDEVDAVTGPALGRPKSATFRTLDVVGLDTFLHVAKNVYDNLADPKEKAVFEIPQFMKEMVERGWLGSKSGQGFFKQVKSDAGKEILVLDYNTFEYRPRTKLNAPSLQAAKSAKDLKTKLRTLLYAKDRAGELAWNVTKKTLLYAAEKLGEIADDIPSIDRAMKWGFGWELGPFELWDSLGLQQAALRMKEEGETLPAWVEEMLADGKSSFYQTDSGKRFHYLKGEYKGVEERPETISLALLKESGKLIKGNSGASLIDLGDGVACLEFHTTGNAIGNDITQIANYALEEVERNYEGLVIGNQGKHFSAGANLMMLLMEAQDENWDEIDYLVRQFQGFSMKMKYFSKPIVAAPFGMTLGGGYEIAAPAAHIQASAETYMGLVETGVGLIPAGGGTKEMLIRFLERVPAGSNMDIQPLVNQVFETIAMAKVSTSGEDAKKLGYLRPSDGISVNQDFLIYDAKQKVLELARAGYRPPVPKKIKVVGEPGYAVMKLAAYSMKMSGYISEHDEKIASKLAFVLAGGNLPAGTEVTEQYLLDLEREAFISLAGEPKSQARMQHMLAKGKPLRN